MHRIDAFTKIARVDSIQGGPSGSPAVASFAGSVLRTGLRRRYDRCPEEEEKKQFRDRHESITPYPSNQRLGAGFLNGTATGCICVSHQTIICGNSIWNQIHRVCSLSISYSIAEAVVTVVVDQSSRLEMRVHRDGAEKNERYLQDFNYTMSGKDSCRSMIKHYGKNYREL